MNFTFDIKGLTNSQARNYANHNLRMPGHYESCLITPTKLYGINKYKIQFNVVLKDLNTDIKTIIGGRKVVGGIQKSTSTHTSFVIQVGDKNNHLDRYETLAVFKKQLEFIEGKFGADKVRHASIHFDETTPHLHIILVNIKEIENDISKVRVGTNAIFEYDGLSYKDRQKRAFQLNVDANIEAQKVLGPLRLNETQPSEKGKVSLQEYELSQLMADKARVKGEIAADVEAHNAEVEVWNAEVAEREAKDRAVALKELRLEKKLEKLPEIVREQLEKAVDQELGM